MDVLSIIVMGWKKNSREVDPKIIFDVKIPDMDFSLESVFGELKSELKEERIRKSKKERKRAPPKAKPKAEKIVEERKTLKSVEDIANKLDRLERTHPVLSERTNDPLALSNTPQYMTQKEFQNHYKLLLDRVQIQLSSLGGGGAVNIRDMEDVDTEFISDPASLDNAVMKMRYLPDQKILQFYGDTSSTFNSPIGVGTSGSLLHEGTDNQINVDILGNTYVSSLSDNIILPGTLSVSGITTLSVDGSETRTGGDLQVDGTARATKFTTTSDERLKKNIRRIEDPLQVIAGIEGVKFNWIADGSDDVGLIAQDVERCLPEAVQESEGVKSVNYNGVIGLLVESVKELSKDNQLLRMEVDSLRRKL